MTGIAVVSGGSGSGKAICARLASEGTDVLLTYRTNSAGAEEGRFGVRVNCVGVGVITDGMYQALVDDGAFDTRFLEETKNNLALRRLGTAEDIAEAVAFPASSRAGYITGQVLMVDGGYAL